jgi:uncharacterized repeat protein (TIGR01451 family)
MLLATFTVTSPLDTGTGTFRQAILDANAGAGADIILFNIPGTSTVTLQSATGALPPITDPVTIDGTSQPGSNRVELNGNGIAGDGLVFSPGGGASTVVGLAINRFGGAGIRLNTGANGITLTNDFIGTDPTGTTARPNGTAGIFVSSASNIIGGTTTARRNLISGNGGGGLTFFSSSAASNVVQNNFIGTDITGNRPLPNTGFGVIINAAGSNTIGGPTAPARNIISANTAGGVNIRGTTGTGNVVQGNFIGTDSTGGNALGNANDGVLINDGASNNTIGGAGGVGGNTIAFNGGTSLAFAGVAVPTAAPGSGNVDAGTGNAILSNNIYSNSGLGIDIGFNGVDLNDTLDTDVGPNNLQNYPLLFQASSQTGSRSTIVQGTLNSVPNTTYTIQFFNSDSTLIDPSGFGEGQRFIGQTTVTTNASGNGAFSATLPGQTFPGSFITATATDPTGNTSEFSQVRMVQNTLQTFVDLGITKTATPNPVNAGSLLTYSLLVTNNGFGTANNVTVTDVLPPGVILVNVLVNGAAPAAGTLTQTGNTLTIDVGTLDFFNNSTATVTIDVRPAVSGTISNRATVSANVFDPFSANDTAAVDTQVILAPGTSVLAFMADRFNVGEGENAATVTVVRTNSAAGTVSINYATTDGTATAGADYAATSGTLTFADNELTKTFFIPIFEDPLIEGNETINLTLSNAQGTAIPGVPSTSLLTIFDNDPPAAETQFLQFSQPTFSGTENSLAATIRVTRTGGTTGTVSVDFATTDGTATANNDYTPTIGTLQFNNGEDTKDIVVPLIDNTRLDGNRTFGITLSNPVGAVLAPPSQAVVTIVDDESPTGGSFQFSSPVYTVGEAGGQATITVTRSGGTGPASVNFATGAGGTATPGLDFVPTSGTLNFAPGDTSRTFIVTILNDNVVEGSETVPLSLSANGDAVVAIPGAAVLTILDDELPPAGVLQFASASYTAAEGGGVATITVSRVGGSAGAVSVNFATAAGTATAGVDYSPVTGVLTFANGETTKTFTIPILQDTAVEGPETVGLVLSSPNGTSIGPQATATLSILDDDVDRVPPTIVDVQLVPSRRGIDRITLTFSEPLDPSRVVPSNFRVVSAGRDGRFGTRDDRVIPIRAVQYVPGTVTVTLILGRVVPRGQFLRVFVNGSPPSGLTDLAGNFLDGNGDGLPGGDFSQTVGQASSLRYIDGDGDIVTLSLRGGGVLELVRSATGEGLTLRVINPRPFRSVISGSVRRARGGDGTTTLQAITGLGDFGQVRSRLTSPPFFVVQQPTVTIRALDAVLASDADTLGVRGLRGRRV